MATQRKSRSKKNKGLSERKVCAQKSKPKVSPASRCPHYVAGIGASAGGLEALRSLFAALKKADHMALVVVQHLAPQYRSRLVELIGHATTLPVKEIEDGEPIYSSTIYITPPNSNVVIRDKHLYLSHPEPKVGPKPSVDLFLTSLAEDLEESAIGIVLSGTGSDGSQGIRSIKTAGGLTFAQKLDSAKYDGMPRSAKQTGYVDFELSPEEIAAQLSELDKFASQSPQPSGLNLLTDNQPEDPFQLVLTILRRETNVDFSQYKQTTIRRRLDRRLVANHCKSLKQYADLLSKNPEEAHFLFQDALISVTSFFRDTSSFKTLGDYLVGKVKNKNSDQNFRAWSVGCATGEEAYSLAILILESMERAGKQLPMQIFATDLDEQAMTIARKGIYSKAGLLEFPDKLKAKYFEETEDHQFKIKEFVRDLIVFARHDVTLDPPFLKMDLISCRNVLIYFNTKLQEQIIKTFNYSLDMGGILFLGKSETTSAADGMFEQVDKIAKIFHRSAKRGDLPRYYSRSELNREAVLLNRDRDTSPSADLFYSMVKHHTPDSVLVDEHGKIKHIFGDAGKYLNPSKMDSTDFISKLISPRMSAELTSLLHRASKTQNLARGFQKYFGKDNLAFRVSVTPLGHEATKDYLISFDKLSVESKLLRSAYEKGFDTFSPSEQVRYLKQDLATTKEHLQTILQEHETSNEELQALNEELQSSNEELQSTNEELETTNEELQSANEELTTLNQEINVKSAELHFLNMRLQAIQNAIFYPLLVVDKNLKLIEYNPAAKFLFRVSETDKGFSIKHLVQQFELLPALKQAEDCLAHCRESRMQFSMMGREYEARVQLFFGQRDQVEGAVLSFVDNTELITALQQAKVHRQRLDAILDHTPALVTMKDTHGCYVYTNTRFAKVIGKSVEEILGKTDEELFGTAFGERIWSQDCDIIKTKKPLQFDDIIDVEGKLAYWYSSKFPLLDERRKVQSVCSISLDITDRVLHEKQLEVFRKVISESSVGLIILEGKGNDFYTSFVSERLRTRFSSQLMGLGRRELLEVIFKNIKSISATDIDKKISEGKLSSITVNLSEILEKNEDWVELKVSFISFGGNELKYLLLMFFDINEQVQSRKVIQANQEEIARFSKLATLGELAAGISHEINTPLSVILTKAQFLRRLIGRDQLAQDRIQKTSTEIEQMVKNISAIIHGLKSLSGMESDETKETDLVGLIQEAAHICDFKIQRLGVTLFLDLPDYEVPVRCNGIQIMQIFINLLNNSVDAISDLSERWIRVELKENDNKVEILVSDSGKGIDSSLSEKIMTPFFTTKKNKKGTGLGLSLSRTIARKHEGDLVLVPEASNTCFKLALPKTGS